MKSAKPKEFRMFISHQLREGFSKFWLTPDVKMGVHYFRCFRDDFYCLPHTHPEYNIVICLGGEMEFDRTGNRENMKAGDVIVLNALRVEMCKVRSWSVPTRQNPRRFAEVLVLKSLQKPGFDV